MTCLFFVPTPVLQQKNNLIMLLRRYKITNINLIFIFYYIIFTYINLIRAVEGPSPIGYEKFIYTLISYYFNEDLNLLYF